MGGEEGVVTKTCEVFYIALFSIELFWLENSLFHNLFSQMKNLFHFFANQSKSLIGLRCARGQQLIKILEIRRCSTARSKSNEVTTARDNTRALLIHRFVYSANFRPGHYCLFTS